MESIGQHRPFNTKYIHYILHREQTAGPGFENLHNIHGQEPITRSLHLPYYSSEPTLSRIFLFLEAPPTEVFAGVFVVTNHERAAVTHCLQVTGNQSYLYLHGLHDSKRKLMFFVHRLIPQRFDRF